MEFRPNVVERGVRALSERIDVYARRHDVTSTVSARMCTQHLRAAYRQMGDARKASLRSALKHFRLLQAAVIEKQTRGKA